LDYRRLSSKEKHFPVFVRDLTLNIKTGMEPVKAIYMLEDNDYKALNDDVKLLASNLKLGVPVDQALDVMAGNTRSRRIKRSISMISGAIRAGGGIEEILTILSAFLINDREMKSEIGSKLFTYQLIFYIIFIIFISMNYFLINNIFPMMGKSGFSVDVDFYSALMFRSTMLLGIFMGMVGGKLTKGSIAGGVPDVFLLVITGYVLNRTIL
jgi:pilus assembly protein TadC